MIVGDSYGLFFAHKAQNVAHFFFGTPLSKVIFKSSRLNGKGLAFVGRKR